MGRSGKPRRGRSSAGLGRPIGYRVEMSRGFLVYMAMAMVLTPGCSRRDQTQPNRTPFTSTGDASLHESRSLGVPNDDPSHHNAPVGAAAGPDSELAAREPAAITGQESSAGKRYPLERPVRGHPQPAVRGDYLIMLVVFAVPLSLLAPMLWFWHVLQVYRMADQRAPRTGTRISFDT